MAEQGDLNLCGKRVRKARRHKDINIMELSVAMTDKGFSINESAMSKLERGYRKVSDKEIQALSEILEQDIEYFFKGGDLFVD